MSHENKKIPGQTPKVENFADGSFVYGSGAQPVGSMGQMSGAGPFHGLD